MREKDHYISFSAPRLHLVAGRLNVVISQDVFSSRYINNLSLSGFTAGPWFDR